MIKIYFKPTNDNASKPIKKIANSDAGFDLFSTEEITIYPGKPLKLSTGISTQVEFTGPEDAKKWYIEAKIEGTSGNAVLGLSPIGGVVDQAYTGEIGVVAVNYTVDPIKILKGKKIAQLVYHALPIVDEVIYLGENDEFPTNRTERGEKGFGSSGTAIS